MSPAAAGGIARAPNFTLTTTCLTRHALEAPRRSAFVVAHAVEVAGIEQRNAGVERGVDVAMLSARSDGPYFPDMPMQPRPRAETVGPWSPSWRIVHGLSSDGAGEKNRPAVADRYGLGASLIIRHLLYGLYEITHNV